MLLSVFVKVTHVRWDNSTALLSLSSLPHCLPGGSDVCRRACFWIEGLQSRTCSVLERMDSGIQEISKWKKRQRMPLICMQGFMVLLQIRLPLYTKGLMWSCNYWLAIIIPLNTFWFFFFLLIFKYFDLLENRSWPLTSSCLCGLLKM